MNAAPSEQAAPQSIGKGSKFVLGSFFFFFLVMSAISLGDLVGAMFR